MEFADSNRVCVEKVVCTSTVCDSGEVVGSLWAERERVREGEGEGEGERGEREEEREGEEEEGGGGGGYCGN